MALAEQFKPFFNNQRTGGQAAIVLESDPHWRAGGMWPLDRASRSVLSCPYKLIEPISFQLIPVFNSPAIQPGRLNGVRHFRKVVALRTLEKLANEHFALDHVFPVVVER